jgi:hypothetical protein
LQREFLSASNYSGSILGERDLGAHPPPSQSSELFDHSRYIKALHDSLPQVSLIAAGGVNRQTAANFILSSATAIGIGTELIPNEAIQRRQSLRIHQLARRFTKLVRDAREQIEAWKKSRVVKKCTGTEKYEK